MGVFSKSGSEVNGGRSGVQPAGAQPNGKTANPRTETASILGHTVLVTGNIVSEGTLQIFGRVNGDIHAEQLIIKEGGQVEGNVVAQETTILGLCKGTIRSNSVRLQGSAAVEGEIYSQSLRIEEDAHFEGVSRRLTTPIEPAPRAQTAMPAKIPLAPAMAEAAPSVAMIENIHS